MRKTRLVVLGLLLVTIISLLSGYMVPDVNAEYETFTSWIEVDPNTHITVTNDTHIAASMYSNEDAYVHSVLTTNRFSEDFSHRLDIYVDVASEGEKPSVWALTESLDDRKGLEDANANFLSVNLNGSTTTFGDTDGADPPSHQFGGGDDIIATQYTTPNYVGSVLHPTNISFYGYVDAGTCEIVMALYENDTYDFVCATNEITITTTVQYWTGTINTTVSLDPNTTYLLTVWHDSGTDILFWRYTDTAGTVNTWKQTLAYDNNWPDPFNPADTYEELGALYVTYASVPTIEVEECNIGSTYTHSCYIMDDTWLYLLIKREEATMNFTLGIYSTAVLRNAAGVADIQTLNLTLQNIVSYDYVLVCQTWNSGSGSADIEIRNLDLQADYEYVFYGLYNEQTGERDGAINVTVHFEEGTPPTTFNVDGMYTFGAYQKPLYFAFSLINHRREYWLGTTEDTASIYIFNGTTTMYTLTFVDLTNVLSDYAFVSVRRQVNGTLHIMEKRRINQDDRIVVALIMWDQYSIFIQDGLAHDYGQIVMSADTTVILTLTGLEFPTTVTEGYKYLRIWAWRDYSSPNTTKVSYQDLQSYTTNVTMTYYVASNKTQVYTTYVAGSQTFTSSWTGADENTTYYVIVTAERSSGDLEYRQVFSRAYSENPFSLDFLWPNAPFNTNVLLPAFILFCVAGVFSFLNVRVGAIAVVAMAIALTAIFALPITEEALILAISLAILLGIALAKRRVVLG